MSAIKATVARKRGRDPWHRPRFLPLLAWGYVAWSIVPVLIAVLFSFNAGRSTSVWQGVSLRWWFGDPSAGESLWYNPELRTAIAQTLRIGGLTMVIAVPLGVLFAIGIDRWRGRPPAAANFVMLLAFVVPEIILGVALFLTFSFLLRSVVHLGTTAQVIGLATLQIPYPFIVVRARLLTISRDYEEAAMDLGGSPVQSIRRVLFPLLVPAVFASAVLVFANSIDDFVVVRYLSGSAPTEPLSVKIYNAARSGPPPSINAAASVMLFVSLLAALLGWIAFRWVSRGRRTRSARSPLVDFRV